MKEGLVLLLLALVLPGATSFFAHTLYSPSVRPAVSHPCFELKMVTPGGKTKLAKSLNKLSLTVSVSVEAGDELLSKQLRKVGVASIFTTLDLLSMLAQEQLKAKGDFPGPAPVILRDNCDLSTNTIQTAHQAGASGIVLPVCTLGKNGAMELASVAADLGMDALWEVSSQEEYKIAAEAGADGFLISKVEDSFGVSPAFWEGIKGSNSVVVAEIKAAQPNSSEIELGRTLSAVGCKAVLLSGAFVKPEEDTAIVRGKEMLYVEQVVKAMRSKASTKIQMSALVGSASAVGVGHTGSTATPPPTVVTKKTKLSSE